MEIFHQGIGNRDACRAIALPLFVALLTRYPDAIDARQPVTAMQFADKAIHGGLKIGRLAKCGQVDNQNSLPSIRHRDMVCIEIDHIASDGRATERSGQNANYKRSEEHTSELQSLMRTSYAVFCLKKKNTLNTIST